MADEIFEATNTVIQLSHNWLSTSDYEKLLLSTPAEKCMDHPPVKPQTGEIFIYLNANRIHDWKSDQYGSWRNQGYKHLPKKQSRITVTYYKLVNENFYKRSVIIFNGKLAAEKTLVHYIGNVDKFKQLAPHGNRIQKEAQLNKEYMRTAKSVLDYQKQNLKQIPSNLYREQNLQDVPPVLSPVMLPRDKKQVSNTLTLERQRRLLSSDDIVGVVLLTYELPSFIVTISFGSKFFAIVCHSDSASSFNNLPEDNNFVLGYDTTFNLGDFFVSPLTFRHPIFDKNPVIPLAYLIHHTKETIVHRRFFQHMKELCPRLDGMTIITDRELAINNAIKIELPKSRNFYCWNHIQQNVKHWIDKHKNTDQEDIKNYASNVWDLLDSSTREEFENKLDGMSRTWTQLFLKYFNTHLYETVSLSGKWLLLEYHLYTPGSGITSNAAESYNSVLKRTQLLKEVNHQVMILVLYQLDLHYQKEIMKGYCAMGDYTLREKFRHLKMNPEDAHFPKSTLPLKDLPYIFLNSKFKAKKPNQEETVHTNFAVAKLYILNDCVKLIPDKQVFIVSPLHSGKQCITTLFPNESCSCKAGRDCTHIMAAKMAIGMDVRKTKNIKLTKLIRKERGFKSGRKNAPKKLVCVEAAVDSKSFLNKDEDTFLLPTITDGKLVKHRFFAPLAKKLNESSVIPSVMVESKNESSPPPSFKNAASSTPNLPRNQSSKKQKPKQYIIFNRHIYDSHLDPLKPANTHLTGSDLFISDSILDVFIPILIHEEANNCSNVTIHSCSGLILNYLEYNTVTNHLQEGLKYFLENQIPETDIVLFPLTQHHHCTLIIAIKKLKLFIYLDSLKQKHDDNVPNEIFEHLFRLYDAYAIYKSRKKNGRIESWNIHRPTDIPLQKNGYDCGLFVCLFSEILIRRNLKISYFADQKDMSLYRERVHDKIFEYLENPTTGSALSVSFDVSTFIESYIPIRVEAKEKMVRKNVVPDSSTLDFLSNLVESFWEESFTICALKTVKCQRGPMVLCEECDHWIHFACEAITEKDLATVGRYVCKSCKQYKNPLVSI